jgi:hypothetical protein
MGEREKAKTQEMYS